MDLDILLAREVLTTFDEPKVQLEEVLLEKPNSEETPPEKTRKDILIERRNLLRSKLSKLKNTTSKKANAEISQKRKELKQQISSLDNEISML